jgi:hypothetical protein
VIQEDAIKHLIVCLQEPEIELKRISAKALSEISKHSENTAERVVEAVGCLAALISHPDSILKRHVCSCLANLSLHSVD